MARFSEAVTAAKKAGAPIVALESTIISHGLPRPKNLEVAKEVESIVRSKGATPATIAIIDGEVCVGLSDAQLERIAREDGVLKASVRDLPIMTTQRRSAATTVAATMKIANQAGIEVFATGGLGGVHRGAIETWDESADLLAIANTPVLVVAAGAKSILDIPATLERLETLSIPLLGYRTKRFPGFYLADSGYSIEHNVETVGEIAQIWRSRNDLGLNSSGMVVANPVKHQMDPTLHAKILESGLLAAEQNEISGKDVTPFLLEYFHSHSDGESLRVNEEIIKANAALAAEIAVAL
jgi:pseudouridine-5'-phosphate glycosidase